jgi:AAA family ATP:ADP antiporter
VESKVGTYIAQWFNRFRNSYFRKFFWPIRSHELKKFSLMAALMFSVLLNQNIVRSIKDALVITKIGPEVISFIKMFGELPLGVAIVVFYTWLCNRMTTENAFRIIVILFIAVDCLFGFVIYPNLDFFHPDPEKIKLLISHHPHLRWYIMMYSQWSFVIMYVIGELWPVIVFSLLFWQLANKITKSEEAARFYPMFSIFGQLNCMIAGSVIVYFSSKNHFLSPLFISSHDKTEILLKSLTLVILVTGAVLLFVHYLVEDKIIFDKKNICPEKGKKKEVLKLTFLQSIRVLLKSRYFAFIAVLLLSYSLTMNLMEGLWMSKVRDVYPTTASFMEFQGRVLFWTGVVTVFCALIGGALIQRFGWFIGAILTPVFTLIVGVIFFASVIFQGDLPRLATYMIQVFDGIDWLEHASSVLFVNPMVLVIVSGWLLNVVSKGLKYSLFDSTKEMAYIPLDNEQKTKGKAIADVLGAKIGKLMGAGSQFIIFTIFPFAGYDSIASFLMTFFIFISIVWIVGVYYLNIDYNKLIASKK